MKKEKKKIAVDYKGKHFIIVDEDRLDEMDFVDQTRNVDFVIGNDNALYNYVVDCVYYGIPAYIGSDTELHKRIEKIYQSLEDEEN